jgi:hypothetical protein
MAVKIPLVVTQPGAAYNASTTCYCAVGMGVRESSAETTEVNAQVTFRSGGILSALEINVYVNTVLAASTLRIRKNGANGNQSTSITASTTGQFSDTTNQDFIDAGDEVNYQLVVGAGGTSLTPSSFSVLFQSDTIQLVTNSSAGIAYSTASVDRYAVPAGGLFADAVSHNANKAKINVAGTWKNLFVNVSANARTSSTTITGVKNEVAGAMTVSVGSGATGFFEDTSNTITVAAGDYINYVVTTGINAGTLTMQHIASGFKPNTNTFPFIVGSISGGSSKAGTDAAETFYPVCGSTSGALPVADTPIRVKGTFGKFTLRVLTNTLNGNTAWDLVFNGAHQAIAVSVTASTTGEFEDTDLVSNSADVECWYGVLDAGTSGAFSFAPVTILYSPQANNFFNLLGISNN